MEIGQSATVTKAFAPGEMWDFAALSGAAPNEHVPEPLIAALFSYLLGVELPGSGTNYLKQELAFKAPAPIDTALTATVTITQLRPEKHLVDLWATCVTPDGTVICEGRSLVKAKDVGA